MTQNFEPSNFLNLNEFFDAAAEVLDPATYQYYVGGTADNVTLGENTDAFQRIQLLPRYLADVSEIDTSTILNGQKSDLPIGIAPMAMMGLAHDEGEIGIAKACHAANVPMILSTMSNTSIEDIAPYHDNLWFQLYVQKDRSVSQDLVNRAAAAGFKALVVTVDVPVPGYRENIIRMPITVPENKTFANLLGYWDRSKHSSLMAYVDSQFDASLHWKDLEKFVQNTDLPVYVKGVLHPDDAQLAIEHGASGIVVSNHGGRQLDTVPATIDVLPMIVERVQGQAEVLMDGGIRRGTDIVKALALGAKGILIGRPIAFSLACGGEAGVTRALAIIHAQLENAMALSGTVNIESVGSDLIFGGTKL